jgi:hypothetical protein
MRGLLPLNSLVEVFQSVIAWFWQLAPALGANALAGVFIHSLQDSNSHSWSTHLMQLISSHA